MSEAVVQLTAKVDWEMGRRNFKYFFEDICGFQLAHFHQEWYDMAENNNKVCMIASRDHGKSVFFRCYILWKMGHYQTCWWFYFGISWLINAFSCGGGRELGVYYGRRRFNDISGQGGLK